MPTGPESNNETRNLPRREMVTMSKPIGIERALMVSPNGAGAYVRGSSNIDAKIAQGWKIVPNDVRNNLLPERMNGKEQESKPKGVSIASEKDPFEHEVAKEAHTTGFQERRGPGRPRKNR